MFISPTADATPIELIVSENFAAWQLQQNDFTKSWIQANAFIAKPGSVLVLPDASGKAARVFVGVKKVFELWDVAGLATQLPEGKYCYAENTPAEWLRQCYLAWGMGSYQFTRYKKATQNLSLLAAEVEGEIKDLIRAIHRIRDLVNTPAEDLHPADLAAVAHEVAKQQQANIRVLVGDELLSNGYVSIHTVGRSSSNAPCLIDMRWGAKDKPLVVLVGKGVCFDTGGLDLKPSSGMLQMKKDMGGAAHALALGELIMSQNLPIQLRVLIPAVENAVSGDAYYPGDVIKTRKGITVEVTNTDAEGRLVLCEPLAEAASENPDLIIDFATLTGAARVALGSDLPALFARQDELAEQVLQAGKAVMQPLWRLPLYQPYRSNLDSPIADMKNADLGGLAGAIHAALFLQEFVPEMIPWVHLDIFSSNNKSRPGRPEGGDDSSIRAIYHFLRQRYQ